MAAIAAAVCPKKFAAISAVNNVRSAALSGGGTVAANAESNAAPTALRAGLAALK